MSTKRTGNRDKIDRARVVWSFVQGDFGMTLVAKRMAEIRQWAILAADGDRASQLKLQEIAVMSLANELDTAQRTGAGFKAARLHAQEKRPEHEQWHAAYDVVRARNPALSHTAAAELVGKQFGVTGRTVRNHIENPK